MTEIDAADYLKLVGTNSANDLVPKQSKYGNVKTEGDGVMFDSKREAGRYRELKLLQDAGEISHLVLQPRYTLVVKGELIATYIGDFEYRDLRTHDDVIEDVKSSATKTPVYRIKKKLMKALYGIEIQEV